MPPHGATFEYVGLFRPCIDLHQGVVKQIVGSTLCDNGSATTNFVATHDAAWFAQLFADDDLSGGHVIQLGPGNESAARRALGAFPGGLQIGGGITADNAGGWIDAGASQVIVTSWLFDDGRFQPDRVAALVRAVGRDRLVLDLSCVPAADGSYVVMTDRWQRPTDLVVTSSVLHQLAESCSEFLIHGVAVEGKQAGMDRALVELLANCCPIPATYAGGATSLDDLRFVGHKGGGRIGLTIGSALDVFGGHSVRYTDAVAYSKWFERLHRNTPTL